MTPDASVPQKFRKKPVVIEARQLTSENVLDLFHWVGEDCREWDNDQAELVIATLEGNMTAREGDWIIKGVKGEFYPCKPDVFEVSYEPVIIRDASVPSGTPQERLQSALVERLRLASRTIYIAVDESVAEHISALFTETADQLAALAPLPLATEPHCNPLGHFFRSGAATCVCGDSYRVVAYANAARSTEPSAEATPSVSHAINSTGRDYVIGPSAPETPPAPPMEPQKLTWAQQEWEPGDKHLWQTRGGGNIEAWCGVCGVLEDSASEEICRGPKSQEPSR